MYLGIVLHHPSSAGQRDREKKHIQEKIYTTVYINYLPVKAAVHNYSELLNVLFMIIFKQPNRFY